MHPDASRPKLPIEQECRAIAQRLAALLQPAAPPGSSQAAGDEAPLGLRRALAETQALLLCAEGPAYFAAQSVRQSFFAVAQLPVLIERPEDLAPLAAGLWRLPGLMAWLATGASDLGRNAALALAHSYGCPTVMLGAAPQDSPPHGARWTLAHAHTADARGAFILAAIACLMLVRLAARARLSELGPAAPLEAAALARLEEALVGCPEHLTALGQHLGPHGPASEAVERLRGWLGGARQLFVLGDAQSLAAAQGWLTHSAPRPYGVRLCPLDNPALPPPWAAMGPKDVCLIFSGDKAASALAQDTPTAWVTAAGAEAPASPSAKLCTMTLPASADGLWPIFVYGLLLALH